jgi:hypothetical protein
VSLQVGTGKAAAANELLVGLARGRTDHQFFSRTFLNRTLHDSQLEYVQNAHASVNCLATANRWGKTTVLSHVHYHGNVYKIGGEPKYLDPVTGAVDFDRWFSLRYNTVHTAFLSETALLVWDEATKIKNESPRMAAFIKDAPRSIPPHITFIHGGKWKFRTLGNDASGIDGNSFYVISIDEAGWVPGLETMMNNVVRIRVADVRGVIHLAGTFKPGISKDFYKFCVRASSHSGRTLGFDHRTDEDEVVLEDASLDQSIKTYLRDWIAGQLGKGRDLSGEFWQEIAALGITPDEFADAIGGRGV